MLIMFKEFFVTGLGFLVVYSEFVGCILSFCWFNFALLAEILSGFVLDLKVCIWISLIDGILSSPKKKKKFLQKSKFAQLI